MNTIIQCPFCSGSFELAYAPQLEVNGLAVAGSLVPESPPPIARIGRSLPATTTISTQPVAKPESGAKAEGFPAGYFIGAMLLAAVLLLIAGVPRSLNRRIERVERLIAKFLKNQCLRIYRFFGPDGPTG